MVKFINKLTGTAMMVAEERVEEYKAAGHKLAADVLAVSASKSESESKSESLSESESKSESLSTSESEAESLSTSESESESEAPAASETAKSGKGSKAKESKSK